MTPQELKNSILQLAIQGKLVEQRAEEGTAAELVEKILAAKNAKSAKKNLTHIPRAERVCEADALAGVSRGARGEKEASATSASLREKIPDDEKPFDIPESWEWVRLGDVIFNHGQKTPSEYFSYIDIGSIDNKNQRLSEKETIVHASDASPRARKIVNKGDVLYATVRPYLHNVCIIDRDFSHEPIASTGFAVMACAACLDNRFLFHFLLSPDFDRYANSAENAKGVAYPAISDKRLYNAIIPLPPLAEQKRIVAKIEELLPLIDRYEKAWSKLEDFNKRFPGDMQKSLLQMAIQGKLVDQRPEEGTGEELYRQIQAEKQRLIKSGKIKKEKPLPEITPDEIPFDIPENWKWVRFGCAITLLSGTDFNPEEYNDKMRGVPYITGASNISESGVYVNRWTESPRVVANRDDVLLVCKGSGYGKTVICDIDKAHIARQIMAIKYSRLLSMQYVRYFLMANVKLIKSKGQGVIPGVDRGSILHFLFPLPPIAEQKRIVAKLEELLPLCERLK